MNKDKIEENSKMLMRTKEHFCRWIISFFLPFYIRFVSAYKLRAQNGTADAGEILQNPKVRDHLSYTEILSHKQ